MPSLVTSEQPSFAILHPMPIAVGPQMSNDTPLIALHEILLPPHLVADSLGDHVSIAVALL